MGGLFNFPSPSALHLVISVGSPVSIQLSPITLAITTFVLQLELSFQQNPYFKLATVTALRPLMSGCGLLCHYWQLKPLLTSMVLLPFDQRKPIKLFYFWFSTVQVGGQLNTTNLSRNI